MNQNPYWETMSRCTSSPGALTLTAHASSMRRHQSDLMAPKVAGFLVGWMLLRFPWVFSGLGDVRDVFFRYGIGMSSTFWSRPCVASTAWRSKRGPGRSTRVLAKASGLRKLNSKLMLKIGHTIFCDVWHVLGTRKLWCFRCKNPVYSSSLCSGSSCATQRCCHSRLVDSEEVNNWMPNWKPTEQTEMIWNVLKLIHNPNYYCRWYSNRMQ